MKIAGIVILIAGVLLTVYTSLTYVTKEEVLDVGKIEINREKEHTATWSPWIGVGVTGVGAALLLMGNRGRRRG